MGRDSSGSRSGTASFSPRVVGIGGPLSTVSGFQARQAAKGCTRDFAAETAASCTASRSGRSPSLSPLRITHRARSATSQTTMLHTARTVTHTLARCTCGPRSLAASSSSSASHGIIATPPPSFARGTRSLRTTAALSSLFPPPSSSGSSSNGGSNFSRPAPPALPPHLQREFDELVKRAQTPAAKGVDLSGLKEGEEMHPDLVRRPKPEFEGDENPSTGERGGPKREPLVHGAFRLACLPLDPVPPGPGADFLPPLRERRRLGVRRQGHRLLRLQSVASVLVTRQSAYTWCTVQEYWRPARYRIVRRRHSSTFLSRGAPGPVVSCSPAGHRDAVSPPSSFRSSTS